MSTLETKCTHCSAVLQIQEEWIGTEALCPACQRNFIIGKNCNAGTQKKSFTFVCPDCNSIAELPESMLGKTYECQICFEKNIANATEEKDCPFCGQKIKYHATVCRFCKRDLTGSEKMPEADTFTFICPDCEAVQELPLSMKDREYECKSCCETHIAKPAQERRCPSCGEMIKFNAKICKKCKKSVPAPAVSADSSSHIKLQTSTASQADRTVGRQDAEIMKKLMFWFWICLGGIIATCGLSSIGALVIFFIMLYKFWKIVPAAETGGVTPGKAVGFCFIPFFSFYWIYVAYYKLSQNYQNFSNAPVKTYALVMLILIWSSAFFSFLGNLFSVPLPEVYAVFLVISVMISLVSVAFACVWLHAMLKIYLAFRRI